MDDFAYYIGIISGTSMDGIDCVLVNLRNGQLDLVATQSSKYPDELRLQLFNVCANPTLTLLEFGQLDIAVGKAFGNAINNLLKTHKIRPEEITAIGSHGQTIFHSPSTPDAFSLQIGDPNTIAHITRITTVADFRQRDVAAGGQGAPLAPLFHQFYFYNPNSYRCILNIGGISNITWINDEAFSTPVGFDTGPGNALMDLWVTQCLQLPFDCDGAWAASGAVDKLLLDRFLSEDYFRRPAPKSTGRELFNQKWLEQRMKGLHTIEPADVQRTLLELTTRTVVDALLDTSPDKGCSKVELLVCGGGAYNKTLMCRLQELLPGSRVISTASQGMPPDWIEACTFAWLASKTINREKIDTRVLTGSREPVVLGGVYYS
jgi:anhydro-N-acetylmuramic acid kinase